jgi:Protein of unknown function (DUF3253)
MSTLDHNSGSAQQDILRSHLVRLLESRAPPKTICPSEGPRALSRIELDILGASEWRDLMDDAREIVWQMRDAGEVEIMQKGQVLGEEVCLGDVKGPIRVRRKVVDEDN